MRVELRSVSVRYGSGDPVLDSIDLSLHSDEWLAVIGPNGAGKSTLLKVMAGLVPHRGSVAYNGSQPAGRRAMARSIAFVPQTPVLPSDMTVAEYVLLGRTPHIGLLGMERPADLAAAADALRVLELFELRNRPLGALSGGERQRAVLARSVAQEPDLLLLDEPTSALDIGHQHHALDLIGTIRTSHHMTVVSVFHDLTTAGDVADRIIALAGGRIQREGPPAAVLRSDVLSELFVATVHVADIGGRRVVLPAPPGSRGTPNISPGAPSGPE